MIWKWSGIVGVDPRPFTVTQLWRMKEGLQEDQWQHTAMLCCQVTRLLVSKPNEIKLEDFNLYYQTHKALEQKTQTATPEQLKEIANYFRQS